MPDRTVFDRGPIPRRDLWRGWPILRRQTDFYVSIVTLPLIGAGAAFVLIRRLVDSAQTWQVVGAVVVGLLFGLFVFFELIRGGLNVLRTRKVLGDFDGVLTEHVHLRQITPEDAPMLPEVYDRVALEANGLPADSPKREQAMLAAGYWWGSSQTLTIADRTTGEVLGFATLNGVSQDGVPEAGLSLGSWARGRGLSGEVIYALGKAVAGAGYSQLRMGTRQNNNAMRRALEGAGATRTADAPHNLPNGEQVDSAWYVLSVGPGDTDQAGSAPDGKRGR